MALGLPSGARQVCCPVERQHGFEQSKVSPHPLILNTGSPASQNAHPPPLALQHGIFGLAQGQAEHCAQRPRRGVALAGAEWRDWPPRVTRGLAFQAASAASVNQAVVNQAVRLSR